MYVSIKELIKKYNLKINGVIHLGGCQGAELLALKGSSKILNNITAIYTEINYDEIYKDCALIEDLDKYLNEYNFKRVMTVTPESDYWGEGCALY